MSKFKLKRQRRFKIEVVPNMHAYAAERRNTRTQQEVEDYQKFEKLLALFAVCFKWADMPSAMHIIGNIANVVTATAMEW